MGWCFKLVGVGKSTGFEFKLLLESSENNKLNLMCFCLNILEEVFVRLEPAGKLPSRCRFCKKLITRNLD